MSYEDILAGAKRANQYKNISGQRVRMVGAPPITEEMERERDRRLNAPRSITSWQLGDPAPGDSAYDKKRGE